MIRDIIVRAVENSTVPRHMPHRESIERALAGLNTRSGVAPGSDRGVILPPRIVRSGGETNVTVLVRRPDMPDRDDRWLLADTEAQVLDALDDISTPGAVFGDLWTTPTRWGSVRAAFHDPNVNGPLSFWMGPTATASVTRTRDAVALTSLESPENPDGPDDPARRERTLLGEAGEALTQIRNADPMPYLLIGAAIVVPVAIAWGMSSARGMQARRAGVRELAAPRENPRRSRRR
jgi:hypothetical protein